MVVARATYTTMACKHYLSATAFMMRYVLVSQRDEPQGTGYRSISTMLASDKFIVLLHHTRSKSTKFQFKNSNISSSFTKRLQTFFSIKS